MLTRVCVLSCSTCPFPTSVFRFARHKTLAVGVSLAAMVAVATILAVSISQDNAQTTGPRASSSEVEHAKMLSESATSPVVASGQLTMQHTSPHIAADQYTALGSGGCRTAVDAPPPAIQLSAESLVGCFAHCNADPSCTAVDWVHGDTQCHLHGAGIVRSAGGDSNTACYRHVSQDTIVIIVDGTPTTTGATTVAE
jgi:hypothetical protein